MSSDEKEGSASIEPGASKPAASKPATAKPASAASKPAALAKRATVKQAATETADGANGGGVGAAGGGGDDVTPASEFVNWSPDQIKAWGQAQKLRSDNSSDRTLVFRQMHIALTLILGGAALAVLGLVLIDEADATKLTAIVSLGTGVIGSGAALLPTGAAAGASYRILARGKEE